MKKKTLKFLIPTLTLTFLLTACAKAQQVPQEPVLTPVETSVEAPVVEETPIETPVEEPEEIEEEIVEPVVTTEKVTEEVKIPFNTVKKNDETLEKGKTVVSQKGVGGIETVTYEVTMTDGKETGRKEIGRVMTKPVVEEVVKVGVKVTASTPAPAPKPTPTPASNPTPVVKVKEEFKTEVIAFLTEEKKDEILLVGETEVEREGVNGERILKYRVALTDGKETGRELISNTVTKEPVSKIVKVGTRVYVSHDENMAKYLPVGYSFGEGGWPFALSGSGIYKGDKLVAGISLEVINMDVNLSHEEQLKLAEFFVVYRWQETVREDVINALKQYHEQGGFGRSGLVSCTSSEFVVQIYYSNAG